MQQIIICNKVQQSDGNTIPCGIQWGMTHKPTIVNRITIDSKSILARLLAAENIIVEHVPQAETACFETDSRRLVLPVWEYMDEDTYDMLVGHEIGHALYTPAGGDVIEAAINAIDSTNPDLVKHYLNVVEDARIERLMKRRYPGLTHNFRRAYTRMYENDQFGFRRSVTDPASLCTIDRLNLRAKVGVHAEVDVPLSIEETVLFHDMMHTETFDEMVEVTRRIYEFAKEPPVEEPQGGTYVDHGPGGDQGTGDPNSDIDNGDPGSHGGNGVPQPVGNDPTNKPEGDQQQQPPKPITNNHKPKVDRQTNTINYFDMPVNFNIDPYIYTYNQILADHANSNLHLRGYDQFRTDSRKYVNMLAKEFELRKAADMHARTSIARSGVLDMNRLHQHQYVEDIFRRNAVVREGKNHGMVMIVDGSSSMANVFNNTVRQVMQLAWFCRTCNIPFDVYVFSSNANPAFKGTVAPRSRRSNDVHLDENFMLFNVLSSSMSGSTFSRAMQVLYHLGMSIFTHTSNSTYSLSGTPLFKSIVAARYIVDRFRTRNNLQVVNTILLTDGEDGDRFRNTGQNGEYGDQFGYYEASVLRDMTTRMQVAVPVSPSTAQGTEAMLAMLRSTTGSNIVGFYIINSHGGKRQLADLMGVSPWGSEIQAAVAEFRNNKYYEIHNRGYDAFFVIPGDALDTQLATKDDYLNKSLTKGRIANAFLKSEQAKQVNRVLLSRFIGYISR